MSAPWTSFAPRFFFQSVKRADIGPMVQRGPRSLKAQKNTQNRIDIFILILGTAIAIRLVMTVGGSTFIYM